MFTEPVSSVLYCYGVYQTFYNKMEIPNLELHEGLPTLDKVQSLNDGKFHVIVLDDLMEYIVKVLRHKIYLPNIVIIIILRLFFWLKMFLHKDLALEQLVLIHIFWYFLQTRDELQAMNLGKQLYPSNSKVFMEAYEDATSTVHGYLVIDCDPTSPWDLKLRTHIFPGEQTVCYLKKWIEINCSVWINKSKRQHVSERKVIFTIDSIQWR